MPAMLLASSACGPLCRSIDPHATATAINGPRGNMCQMRVINVPRARHGRHGGGKPSADNARANRQTVDR
eukprot:8217543-Lingulodinium_polyedra.AAC.1